MSITRANEVTALCRKQNISLKRGSLGHKNFLLTMLIQECNFEHFNILVLSLDSVIILSD
jgi:hypothetical protein